MIDIKEFLLLWFIIFKKINSASIADKSVKGSGVAMLQNEQLAEELHKTIIRKYKKGTVYSSFKDNIWGVVSLICN